MTKVTKVRDFLWNVESIQEKNDQGIWWIIIRHFFFFHHGKAQILVLQRQWNRRENLRGVSSAIGQFRAIPHPGEIKALWPARPFRLSEEVKNLLIQHLDKVVLLQWRSCEEKKLEKLHHMLRCFIRVQLLKIALEGTNPWRCKDQIWCQLCQSAFFKTNVSAGKFAQLNKSRTPVPTGCLLPALPSPRPPLQMFREGERLRLWFHIY